MREAFLAFERRSTALALFVACAMLVAAACIGLYQILSRFVFEPAEWSEVLVRFTLIWMVFMGAPVAFRQGAMVCVDLAYRKGGPVMKRALDWLQTVNPEASQCWVAGYSFGAYVDVALGIMVDYAKNKYSIAITPDGPRGPRQKFKAGAVITAKKTNIPLVLAGVAFKRKKLLSNWDKFGIPYFFTVAQVVYSDPIYVDTNLT